MEASLNEDRGRHDLYFNVQNQSLFFIRILSVQEVLTHSIYVSYYINWVKTYWTDSISAITTILYIDQPKVKQYYFFMARDRKR